MIQIRLVLQQGFQQVTPIVVIWLKASQSLWIYVGNIRAKGVLH